MSDGINIIGLTIVRANLVFALCRDDMMTEGHLPTQISTLDA